MNLTRGERSVAIRQPEWYRRRRMNRPAGIASRGPYRKKRPCVEDALERLDAVKMYPGAGPAGVIIVEVTTRRGESELVRKRFPPDARSVTVYGQRILLLAGRPFRFGGGRFASFACPRCKGHCRYLFLVAEDPSVACRKCHNLSYRSNAQSAVARARKRDARARQTGRFDGRIRYRFFDRFREEERRFEDWEYMNPMREFTRQDRAAENAKKRERKRQDQELRRLVRAAWREYLDRLQTRRLQDCGRLYRKTIRTIPFAHDPFRRMIITVGLEALAKELPEPPPDIVIRYDLQRAA